MQYCSNMSTERDSMSGVNNENPIKLGYFYPSGRLSPSSWDDSNEEQSDVDSSASVGQEKLAKDKTTTGDFFPVDITIQDRRKSLARMRRRTRSGSSPVSDIVKGKDFSESCDGSGDSSPERSTRKYEEVTSPDQLPVSQSGNDSNSDEIISNIENYQYEKSFSPINSKLVRNQSNVSKCVTLLNGTRANQSGTSEHGIEFRSNLDGKLSKIVEVEEKRSNMSLRNSKTSHSAVPVCFRDYVKCNADDHFSYSEALPIPEISETEEKTVPVEFISEEKLINLTDEDDSDDSDLWKKIRSTVRGKNSEYSMNYEDSQYVTRSLKFIFDEKERHKASSDDGSDTKNENVRVTLNKVKFENEASADEIRENRKGEMPFTGVADSSDGMLNNASSKETVDFGLENLFCVGRTVPEYCSTVSYAADGNGMGKDVREITPRSGRETFLIRECSMAWKLPSNRCVSKRVRSNHTISLSIQDKLTDCKKCTDQSFFVDDDRDRNPIEEANGDCEIPIRRESRYTQNRKMTDLCFGSTGNSLIDNSNWMKNAGNNDVKRNDSNQSSPTSFRSKILLDLDLSDNEEKCSTMERIIFSDSPENLNKSFTPRTEKITTSCPSKNSAGIEQKTTEIGKSGMRESMEFDNRNAYVHNYDQFEIGDNKWNRYEKLNREINLPQDRGDVTYETPDTQPDWGNLITSLECTSHVAREKSKENVFWIDLRADPIGAIKFRQPENPSESDWVGPKWESRLGLSKISLDDSWKSNEPNEKSHFSSSQNRNRRRTKAKKRKRVNLSTEETAARQTLTGKELRNRWGDRLFDGRGNWLVNNVTRRKDVLTRGKQWIQTLILTRKRNGRTGGHQQKRPSNNRPISNERIKSTDCFSNLFKQFVNIFTVSPKTRK